MHPFDQTITFWKEGESEKLAYKLCCTSNEFLSWRRYESSWLCPSLDFSVLINVCSFDVSVHARINYNIFV